MAEVPLDIRVTMDSAAVKKALRGIQKEVAKGEQAAQKEITKTDQARSRSAQRQKAQVQQLGREFKRLGSSVERELQKSMFTGVKNGFRKSRDFLRRNKGTLAIGALTGAAAAGRSAYRRGTGFLGLPTQAGAFQNAVDYRIKFRQFANAAGMSNTDRDAFMKRVRGKSEQTGAMEGDILSGAARVQAAMGPSGLIAYEAQLDNLLNINQSLGAPVDDLAGVLVELNRQFGLTADQFPEALGFMVEAANEGSIEVTDFAGQMRESMGSWAAVMGSGIESWKQFVAVAEAGGTTYSADKVSVSIERGSEILDLLRGTKEGRKLGRKYGLDLTASPIELGRQLRENNIGTEGLKELFPDARSRRLFRTLRDQGHVAEGLLPLRGEAGLNRAKQQAAEFRTSPEGKILAQRTEIFRNVNEQFEDVAFWAEKVAGQFQVLASQNVVLSQGLGVLGDALIAAGVVMGATKIAESVAKKGAEKAITTAATAATGTTAGGAAAGTGMLPVIAPLAAGAIAGGASLGGSTLMDRSFPMTEEVRRKRAAFLGMGTRDATEAARDLKEGARDMRRAAGTLAETTANVGRAE